MTYKSVFNTYIQHTFVSNHIIKPTPPEGKKSEILKKDNLYEINLSFIIGVEWGCIKIYKKTSFPDLGSVQYSIFT